MNKIENISSNKLDISKENIIPLLKSKQKSLPTKYLYDDKGSKLFEEICNTDEYYLTRTEKKILSNYSFDISFPNYELAIVFVLGSCLIGLKDHSIFALIKSECSTLRAFAIFFII